MTVQDAVNLGWKLAATVRGWAPADLLDTYDDERRPVAERVVASTLSQSALVRPGPEVSALRTVFDELLASSGGTERIAHLLAGTTEGFAPRSRPQPSRARGGTSARRVIRRSWSCLPPWSPRRHCS
ncbi:FAD-dependent monooxygenase [Streptomyces sp. NPDC017991]|uniref:FAD-dependent monooxygenase n=1 Tax=Streptomyces sp. NPDC017991 TaxID=3365026 RepID=UPI0037A04136